MSTPSTSSSAPAGGTNAAHGTHGRTTGHGQRKGGGHDAADQFANLLSMLRAAVIWRANDIAESTHRRHARREVLSDGEGVARSVDFATPATALDEVQAREVCALLAADFSAPSRALLLIGQGDSISEAARRTGASRQQVYRARELLRVAVGEDE